MGILERTYEKVAKEAIDDSLIAVRRIVRDEFLHFGRRRRQANQIKGHAAQQKPFVRRPGGMKPLRFERVQDEVIDRRSRPRFVLNARNRRFAQHPER